MDRSSPDFGKIDALRQQRVEDWINNVHPSGYYRRHHMLLEMETDDGKNVTMELQLGTAKQTKIADCSHD